MWLEERSPNRKEAIMPQTSVTVAGSVTGSMQIMMSLPQCVVCWVVQMLSIQNKLCSPPTCSSRAWHTNLTFSSKNSWTTTFLFPRRSPSKRFKGHLGLCVPAIKYHFFHLCCWTFKRGWHCIVWEVRSSLKDILQRGVALLWQNSNTEISRKQPLPFLIPQRVPAGNQPVLSALCDVTEGYHIVAPV